MAAAFQSSSHRVSAPALAVLANDNCRADAQMERTLSLPLENALGYHPVQVDATQCGGVVSRNTHAHACTRTHTCMHAHTDAHTHTHVHARTHIHTRGVERCTKRFTGLQA